MVSGQKKVMRKSDIYPKETDLRGLGLTSQKKGNIITSQVNSQSKKFLKDKSPFEMMKFLNPVLL